MKIVLLVAGLMLAQALMGQSTVVRWLPSRALRTTDFRVVKRGQTTPASLGANMAVTRTGFIYSLSSIASGAQKGKVLIRVYAQMDPAHSYILEKVAKGPAVDLAYLLNHEQKHFDISEIYARELSRFLQTQPRGSTTMEHITREAKRLFAELHAFQKKYDADTNNGRNKKKQEQWNALIARRLKALEPYAARDYILSGYR
ncbi:DUF922 domain-containing protein [Niabella hirudinis]|uniref:DUF922 domain-containing protein n=1 Tax=Niabella hirudinis TaxID=1285929 RepID=UPI003EBB9B18